MKFYGCSYYLNSVDISKAQLQQELAQKEYTDTHVANVQKAWNMMKRSMNCMKLIEDAIKMNRLPNPFIALMGFVRTEDLMIDSHDNSKYGPYEWEPYRFNFYPVDEKEKELHKEEFDKAWIHHYTVNKHHWNHWTKVVGDPSKMDLLSVVELCCDWIAMNFVFPGTALDFYNKRVNSIDPNEKIILGEEQSKFIYELLTLWYTDYPKK